MEFPARDNDFHFNNQPTVFLDAKHIHYANMASNEEFKIKGAADGTSSPKSSSPQHDDQPDKTAVETPVGNEADEVSCRHLEGTCDKSRFI